VRPQDRSGTRSVKAQGYLVLNGTLGKAGNGDAATIIQHPDGNEKQIAIRKNEIVDVDQPQSITYVSDTAPALRGLVALV
jgi:endonuclease G